MSVLAIRLPMSALPISQLSQNELTSNEYFNEVPGRNAKSERIKATLYMTAAVITTIAIVAIIGAVLAVSLGAGTLTGALPFILVGLALATPFLSMAVTKLATLSRDHYAVAELEQGIADEFQAISHWKTSDIEEFLQKYPNVRNRIPLETLSQINPSEPEPLRALLPLIARFKYCNETLGDKIEESAQDHLNGDAVRNSPNDEARLLARRQGYAMRVKQVFTAKLNAALLLRIMQEPTFLAKKMSDLGDFQFKDPDQRFFDLTYQNGDDYFVAHENSGCNSLTHAEIVEDLNPEVLCNKLFMVKA